MLHPHQHPHAGHLPKKRPMRIIRISQGKPKPIFLQTPPTVSLPRFLQLHHQSKLQRRGKLLQMAQYHLSQHRQGGTGKPLLVDDCQIARK